MREYYSTQLALVVGILILMVSALFALVQSPEQLQYRTAAERDAMALPHPVQGMEDCQACHGFKADHPYPQNHIGWSDQSCTKCHEAPN